MAIRDMVPFGNRHQRGITRRGEQNPFARMHEEMDRMFQDFFGDFPALRGEQGEEWGLAPEVDVRETDKDIRVKAELPGVSQDDVDIRIEGNALIIKGEKKEESEDSEGDYYRSECRYGSFMRTIPLAVEVQKDKVEATFKNGVLRVILPKTSEQKAAGKRINVRHG